MDLKECAKCGEKKPLTDYYRNRHASDGHASGCKDCHRLYLASPAGKAAQRSWSAYHIATQSKHRKVKAEESRRADRIARGIDPDAERQCRRCGETKPEIEFNLWRTWCRDCTRACDRKYLDDEGYRAMRRERSAQYRAEHPGFAPFDAWRTSRHYHNQPAVGHRLVTIPGLIWLYGDECPYCGDPFDMSRGTYAESAPTIDHIIPRSHPASTHTFGNTVVAHRGCNARKGALSLEEFVGKERAQEIRQMVADAAPRFLDAGRFA